MINMSIDLDNLLPLLTCPKHSSNKIIQYENQLKCNLCGITVGIIITRSPVKINFLNDFNSGLLKGTMPVVEVKKYTNWKSENIKFLLEMKIKNGIVVDLGSGVGVFHSSLDLRSLINIDFTNYPITNLISNLDDGIPLSSESVDSIIMANILEHLQETKVVNEAYRILKKNGHLYITIPFLLDVHQPPYDFHRYTYIYLTNLLVRQGFEIELIQPSRDFGTFQTLAEHYYRFIIDKGSLPAKLLWQFQKIINWLLKNTVQINQRLEFTGGYMISAIKK